MTFLYFSRLYEKHRKKVLPIAVFAHGNTLSEPARFDVAFPFFKVMQFEFYKIQLKQIPWRQYLNSGNTLAALLSKLDYQPSERLQVKLEFLRLLTEYVGGVRHPDPPLLDSCAALINIDIL
ncbi:MAG: hypothetical protein M1571_03160 [Firmicutes bacterium]|nr:hypothetical protein [Bacillota bacterium]